MKPFRNNTPIRTYRQEHARYQKYKEPLRLDFHQRCGYCNDRDVYYGGKRSFHIDHFRPRATFPELTNHYHNLVYACPYCNSGKSNDWPGDAERNVIDGQGYVDPCDPEYTTHFDRYDDGRIHPKTDIGRYMFKQMHLYLRRHQLTWLRDQLRDALDELGDIINEKINTSPDTDDDMTNCLRQYYQLASKYLAIEEEFEADL